MGRKAKTRILYANMNGRRVGRLEKRSNGTLAFTYDQAWLDWEGTRALSLSLPLIQRSITGDVVENYFDNLLPDNTAIRNRIQAGVTPWSSSVASTLALAPAAVWRTPNRHV
ncbi:MAG: HipA N-terminal domain-containing protein [Gammaproteobacteria bacterium]